jgi:hypothetical protein
MERRGGKRRGGGRGRYMKRERQNSEAIKM